MHNFVKYSNWHTNVSVYLYQITQKYCSPLLQFTCRFKSSSHQDHGQKNLKIFQNFVNFCEMTYEYLSRKFCMDLLSLIVSWVMHLQYQLRERETRFFLCTADYSVLPLTASEKKRPEGCCTTALQTMKDKELYTQKEAEKASYFLCISGILELTD